VLQIGRDGCDQLVIGHRRYGLDTPYVAHHRQAHELRLDKSAADEPVSFVDAQLALRADAER
jgi:hypothetical protein